MSAAGVELEPLGESALLLRLRGGDPDLANARIHALAARLARDAPAAVHDIVPAWSSLAVVFDGGSQPAAVREQVRAWLQHAVAAPEPGAPPAAAREHRLAVRFGGEDGPDLAALAAHAGLAADVVVRRFCAPSYRVAMLGFAPGFPYLLGLDPALAMPRLPSPRAEVAAGSVAIADRQAGIYPQASPGGWRVLGRTAAVLFDPLCAPPALLAPGDRVRFVPA